MITDISYQNTDVALKAMAEKFKNTNLAIYGLQTAKIKALMPTEMPVIEANIRRNDVVFLLEDNTLLHLEFQNTQDEEDLRRFMHYDSRLSITHKLLIKTAVIYTGEIEEAPHIVPYGSITYKVENVFMSNYDGDQKYEEIKQKFEKQNLYHDPQEAR